MENKKIIKKENSIDKNTRWPVLISRTVSILPNVSTLMDIGREMTIAAIKESIKKFDSKIIVASQIDHTIEKPKSSDINKFGVLCSLQIINSSNKSETEKGEQLLIKLKGIKRVAISNVNFINDMYVANFEELTDKNDLTEENKKTLYEIIKDFKEDFNKQKNDKLDLVDKDIKDYLSKIKKASDINGGTTDFIYFDYLADVKFTITKSKELQSVLEELEPNIRMEKFFSLSIPKNKADSIDADITKKINKNLSKQQKEFYLRERLRVIREELGDVSSRGDDADSMRDRVRNNPYPQHIKDRLLSEINKMELSSNSNEAYISKSYIDTLLELPWWQKSEDSNDIKKVISILNKNHYGLEKVKETIIEYLATRMRSKNVSGSVLCLVGPPGVGKTSLAKSIAEALNKKFAKVSLGGMKDEAEIKGHRKTYVGAMPGRIIKEMKKVGVINPLFLLDEIDKISSDHRGDPSSTLLDILDKEQNKFFSDNYVEEEYDLSNVLFIATANYEENIPEALKDRLEIIRLDSYTENEKLSIAEKYLVPRVLKETGLSNKELNFSKEGLDYIIKRYTREAGVRELERCIRKISRKYVVELIDNENLLKFTMIIDEQKVKHYLKKEIFDYTNKDTNPIPGIVNGMAYTTAGGDLLPIEVAISKGKGKFHITGNLKETMKESVAVALGFVKVNAEKFGINQDFNEIDFHIHVPSGGIPKDGPSAGVTLTTAIISALTNKAVPTNVAMTGEITLRGKVLIIGGVKEKVISAVRGGVNEIFIPVDDERYLDDIPKEVLRKTKINLVNTYQDIFNKLFL